MVILEYTIGNFYGKYDHIQIQGFDDTKDAELWNLVNIIEKIIDSECIYFEWSRDNFFADKKEREQDARLAFNCFQNDAVIQRIESDTFRFRSSLYVGYQNNREKAKEAMFYSWRAFEDVGYYSSGTNTYANIIAKYKNKTIVFSGEALLDYVGADIAMMKNDTGDTLLIFAKDLSMIEQRLLELHIAKA